MKLTGANVKANTYVAGYFSKHVLQMTALIL